MNAKKLLASANGKPCIRCHGNDGEVRACHYNGFRAGSYGKGRGIKCHDLATAELCQRCDQAFSESAYPAWSGGSKSIERSEEFLHLIMQTNIRRAEDGVL